MTLYQNQDLSFASVIGTPTNSKNFCHRSFKPILKRVGLPDIVFYGLRHTCATIRSMKGQHLEQVQELLGHSSVAVTVDIYSYVTPRVERAQERDEGCPTVTCYCCYSAPRYVGFLHRRCPFAASS